MHSRLMIFVLLSAGIKSARASVVDDHESDVRVLLEALQKYAPASELAATKAELSASLSVLKSRKLIAAEYVENQRPTKVRDVEERPEEGHSKLTLTLGAVFFFGCWLACMYTLATDAINYKCLRERYGWDL